MPNDEEYADVEEFFETEEDALLAKDLLIQYKRENGIDQNESLYEDGYNTNLPATTTNNDYIDNVNDDYGNIASRLTPRQVDTRYLLETEDDIPPQIKKSYWVMGSRHNELLNIHDPRQYLKYARENRDIVRTTGWQREHRKIPYSDIIQIEHYSNRLLTKSWKHGERLLQSTTINRNEHADVSEPLPNANSYGATQVAGGLIGRLGRIFK